MFPATLFLLSQSTTYCHHWNVSLKSCVTISCLHNPCIVCSMNILQHIWKVVRHYISSFKLKLSQWNGVVAYIVQKIKKNAIHGSVRVWNYSSIKGCVLTDACEVLSWATRKRWSPKLHRWCDIVDLITVMCVCTYYSPYYSWALTGSIAWSALRQTQTKQLLFKFSGCIYETWIIYSVNYQQGCVELWGKAWEGLFYFLFIYLNF